VDDFADAHDDLLTNRTRLSIGLRGVRKAITSLIMFFESRRHHVGCLVYGGRLVRYLGHPGMGVITRLMGLILAAIGMQMTISGVTDLIRAAA
jgi:small neutral amino acid transporter SnatA (MarC family)